MARARLVIPILLGLLAFTFTIALAVQLTLDSDNVERIGGTGQVAVLSPENDDTINKVEFTIETNPADPDFGDVVSVDVTWEPAENGNYFVMVILYDNSNNVVGYGTATPTGLTAGSSTTTTVTLSDTASPEEIYKVEVILQEDIP